MNNQFIDLHCHPAMKPFGKSFDTVPGQNNKNRFAKNSVWYYDPPTLIDKAVNVAISITKFTQSDMSSLCYGGAHVIFISLYPLEKGFVLNKLGDNLPSDLLKDLVMGVGKKRIDHLQTMKDYFTDLQNIYKFYEQLDGVEMKIEGEKCRYKLVSGFDEIVNDPDRTSNTIYLILTIEGANVFNTGLHLMKIPVNQQQVLDNIGIVKNWKKRLFFITFAHHFYNDLCGHAKSMDGISAQVSDQSQGINSGFTDFGRQVLHKLLDKTSGRRILIDIKHMSVATRNEYYQILKTGYPSESIPLIVSHGAVNGYKSADNMRIVNQNTFGMFMDGDINFFDDELVAVARSYGLFGIQLDERRVASKSALKKAGKQLSRRNMLFHRSKLIWNQIQHIAETLNREDMFGWGIQTIGSDFDGLIDPLNGFWGAEQMALLDSYLEKHAYNYLNSPLSGQLKPFNRISPDEIVERFMHDNAWEFLRKNF
jgi:microsomal dipeptidase-like Zn-dependent dipeptidase